MAEVLVIDDGGVGRLGRSAALEAAGHRPTAMGWEEAGRLAGGRGSTRFDLVLAGLRPDPSSWDRYPMLATVSRLRESLDGRPEVVAILWGSAVGNPLLGLRLARAGVTRVVPAEVAACAASLHRVVTDPHVGRPPAPTSHQLACVGVGADSEPDAVVAWVMERAARPESGSGYRNAFDPAHAQNTCGLSRRQAHTLRVRLAQAGRILPSASRGGGGPVRDTSVPRWAEVVAVVNLCRGFEVADRPDQLPVGAVEPRRFVA